MKKKKTTILSMEDIEIYDWDRTRLNVRNYFSKYRNYMSKINLIEERYTNLSLEDDYGIFSTTINDPTLNKVEQMDKYNRYIDNMNKHLKIVMNIMTCDEKIILKNSILDNLTDEELSECLNIARQHIYNRKKSCYIKVAQYFDLEVERDTN